jgi:hypothetical protein
MKEIVSPDVAKPASRRKPRTRKHIVTPATADEISKAVGVTKKDAALVTKVLLRLGYIKEEEEPRKMARPGTAKRGKLKVMDKKS